MVVRASTAAMVFAVLLVFLCVSCVFLCCVQLLDHGHTPWRWRWRWRSTSPYFLSLAATLILLPPHLLLDARTGNNHRRCQYFTLPIHLSVDSHIILLSHSYNNESIPKEANSAGAGQDRATRDEIHRPIQSTTNGTRHTGP